MIMSACLSTDAIVAFIVVATKTFYFLYLCIHSIYDVYTHKDIEYELNYQWYISYIWSIFFFAQNFEKTEIKLTKRIQCQCNKKLEQKNSHFYPMK